MCSKPCRKRDISHGCNRYCQHSIVDDHSVHECEAQYKCIEECSAPDCSSLCTLDLEHAASDLAKAHDCGKKRCLVKCHLEGCNLICKHSDHFHGLGAVAHFCNTKEHPCIGSESMCSVEVGRCNNRELLEKLSCSLVIETGRLDHVGPHYCKTDHFCDEKCPCGCLEYCIKKLELKQNESIGQRAFRAHNGACSTSSHTFSNRTEKEFQETIKQLKLNAQKAVQTGAITVIKAAVTEHLHSFEEPKNTVGDVDDQFNGLRDAGLKLCDWSREPVKRLTVSLSTAEFLISQYRTNCSKIRKGNDKPWVEKCQIFINSVINQRIARVTSWIEINFPVRERLSSQLLLTLDSLIESYRMQYFPVLMNEWTLCRNVCQQKTGESKHCQRECLLLKSIFRNEQWKGARIAIA